MLGAAVGRGEVGETEAVGLAGPLQIGGEAVTHNVGQMLYLLLTRPELMARMRERPDARGTALDELLRWISHRTSVGLARIASEDVEVHGVRIGAGDPVYVSYLAANRDPDVFLTRTGSTSTAIPTRTSPSATGTTTAPVPSSRGCRPSCSSTPCWSGCRGCGSRSPPTRWPGAARP